VSYENIVLPLRSKTEDEVKMARSPKLIGSVYKHHSIDEFVADDKPLTWQELGQERQRKIMLLGKKIKWELMGEWSMEESRYVTWRTKMKRQTGFDFPEEVYNNL